ncbi:MAG: restriction endonuclease subunit S [Chloroflexi bacterium]|nr:restriction endonuclease subunit S [Chloroflexota bacterium]
MWKTIRIADFGSVITGKTPSSNNPEHFGDDYPFITPTDIGTGRIVHADRGISQEGYLKFRRQILPRWSVCFVCIGATIGKICLTTEKSFANQQINSVVVDTTRHDPFFVYYLLSTYAEAVKGIAGGAATPIVNKTSFENIEVVVPPLPTQRKIAAIFSAYDDLIENNLRRINILEEMAQNLYREWFVKFRFPGHQHARFTDSPLGRIPEGWEVREMQEIAEVIDCLHSKKPAHNQSGTGLLLQLCNIGDGGKIDLSDKFLIADDDYQKWTSRIEVQVGDCVVTNVGRVGAVAQIPTGMKAAIGRNMTAIRPFAVGPTYLIEYLLSPHMIKEVQVKKDAGAIMDSLNVKGIVKLLVPVAPRARMDLYEETTRPMRALVERLFQKNTILRCTRDLLLPRLISGEVDVSELDLVVPEEAAV